ncbi:DUF2850 domain-containing protein [Photobacterium sp. 1_MG-2023]|uniref:DUF2850 domain-containing protein n=1 Tax=Photobacterium sp. 1_MG-2023 TaxID=3062646 RepID=UPI0026E20FF5|nr:DUF2850 domain-containing protein [Photobacterium sp. 1_MG-2023]MDO6707772.1 DUF2850 domain-containing protein [Photobacterium sp. 1_MG-2023]
MAFNKYTKWQTATMLTILGTGLALSGFLAVGAAKGELFTASPEPSIFGIWVEQDVAPYAADKFEVRQNGVYVSGRLISTTYGWDGSRLSYQMGGETYQYTFEEGQFIRQKPAHYVSTFARQAARVNPELKQNATQTLGQPLKQGS